jgi:hypothetical protein
VPDEVPTIDQLRDAAAQEGVHPDDADLEAVQAFLRVLVPQFRALERLVPADTVPAGMFVPTERP